MKYDCRLRSHTHNHFLTIFFSPVFFAAGRWQLHYSAFFAAQLPRSLAQSFQRLDWPRADPRHAARLSAGADAKRLSVARAAGAVDQEALYDQRLDEHVWQGPAAAAEQRGHSGDDGDVLVGAARVDGGGAQAGRRRHGKGGRADAERVALQQQPGRRATSSTDTNDCTILGETRDATKQPAIDCAHAVVPRRPRPRRAFWRCAMLFTTFARLPSSSRK